ncbi:phage tail tape measure protein [Phocoenobacter skyensis]|uniref:Phage tail tape measure protein n=1 Tax=Phocoenobacter skyensis TaxID=97481 RepID=A0ABT9JN29_9PAST|nr:phage tail tape measure protein [Pasteurella skyensis]MDP8080250.1 phage tail tape measure protein [Pasteurella skyensis]MDP8086211.1 phage tail tape measure protein [Pasteurella skyensis]
MAKELLIGLAIGATLKGSFSATFGRAEKTIGKLGNALTQAQTKNQRLSDKITRSQQRQRDLWGKIYQAQRRGDTNLAHLQGRYLKIKTAISNAKLEQQRYTQAISKSVTAQSKLQQALEKQQQLKIHRDELKGKIFGSTATTVATGMGVWGGVKSYMQQEDAANDLKIAMMKANGSFGKFHQIGKIADGLGKDLPGTRKDFYNLAQALKKQGVTDDILVNGGLATSAKLNVLLGMDQYSGGEFLAKFMEGHGLKESELSKSADYLQRAMYAGGLNKEQMYGAMTYYATNVRALGLTGADNTKKLLAIQGMAGQQGLEGTSFGTNFSTMLDRMNKGPKMIAEARKGMKAEARDILDKSGVEFDFYDKKGKFKGIDAMVAELEKLETIKKKYGEESAGLVAEGIFGVEGKRVAMLLATKGRKGMADFLQKMDEQASLQDRIEQKTNTLGAALESLGGVWESATGAFGSAFASDIKSFAKTATVFIEGTLTPWIATHKDLIKSVVGAVLGFSALKTAVFATQFIFSGFSSVLSGINVTFRAFKAIQAMTQLNRLNGIVSLFSRILRFSGNKVKGFSRIIRGGFTSGLSKAKNLMGWFGKGAFSLGKALSGRLLNGLKLVGRGILFLGRALLMNPIGLLITGIGIAAFVIYKHWTPIKSFFGDLWTSVTQKFTQASQSLNQLWTGVSNFFSEKWQNIQNFFSSGIGNISATILNWSPLGLFYQVFKGVMSWFGIDLPNKFSEFGSNIINGLTNGISNAWTTAKEKVSGLGDSVKGWFKEKLNINSPSRVFIGYGKSTVKGLAIGIDKNLNLAKQSSDNLSEAVTLPTIFAKNEPEATPSLFADYQPLNRNTVTNNETHKNSGMTVHFNPTINVNGNSGQGMVEQVQQGLRMTLPEFERLFKQMVDQQQWRAY